MIADEIAKLVIDQYSRLAAKGKPLVRSNGVKEWTVLAGIVIRSKQTDSLECVSLATGVKALPNHKLAESSGRFLHDSHAEILAIRAFNRYILDAGVDHIDAVYLYVCAPPCGDASMSLLNGADSWDESRSEKSIPQPNDLIRGRAHFNLTGHIRTKPGRGDSQLTMSKSCSDKLCIRQARGLLLCPVRLALGHQKNLYLDALVCPVICPDFDRAFSRFHPVKQFEFWPTSVEFEDFHPNIGAPSPISLVWWATGTPEVIANGVLQGSKNRASELSRVKLVEAAVARSPSAFAGIHQYLDLKTRSTWPLNWERTAVDDFKIS